MKLLEIIVKMSNAWYIFARLRKREIIGKNGNESTFLQSTMLNYPSQQKETYLISEYLVNDQYLINARESE